MPEFVQRKRQLRVRIKFLFTSIQYTLPGLVSLLEFLVETTFTTAR